MTALNVIHAGPEHAPQIVDIIHRSFGARPTLDPPSDASEETVESVAKVLDTAGGLLVERRGLPMGAMLFDESRPGQLGLKRVCVDPDIQARGVASAMTERSSPAGGVSVRTIGPPCHTRPVRMAP